MIRILDIQSIFYNKSDICDDIIFKKIMKDNQKYSQADELGIAENLK